MPEKAAANKPPDHQCPACRSAVPAAPFCGECGAPQHGRRLPLRPATFAVAPDERIEWPLVTSSMFPHLAEKYRTPFRHGLFLVLTMLVVFSLLRLLGPLVIVVSFGIPLLFGLYVWRSDAFSNISAPALAVSVVLGAGLSAAWWIWTGNLVADEYDIPLGAASQLQGAISFGLVITLVGAAIMLLPALTVRMLRLPARESLDGFLIGALGALSYSAAGTITWLAPQFFQGLLNNYGPGLLLEQALLYGLVDPLTAAATGGLVGLALWFRPAHREGRQPRHIRALLWILAALCTALYMGVYVLDASELPRFAEIGFNTVITAAALVTARIGVQAALLYEDPQPASHELVHCEQCEQTVPEMPFCPQCGAATQALSRSVRRLRRQAPPQPATGVE
ncbi:MAG: zinc ribbon domain-containing protein [Mycobacterium sp.]|nr:zinc ribbon domain-containing protein [Mycobacterium sp.]